MDMIIFIPKLALEEIACRSFSLTIGISSSSTNLLLWDPFKGQSQDDHTGSISLGLAS